MIKTVHNYRPMFGITLILLLSVFAVSAAVAAKPHKITEAQAVEIAEKYIAENGYTKAPARKGKLDDESLSRYYNPKWTDQRERELRYDSLEPKAYGIFGNQKNGWGVIFRFSETRRAESARKEGKESIDDRKIGRCLKMDPYGKNLLLMHKDIFLRAADKVLLEQDKK